MERIEDTILRNLLYNEEFARKTLPFIKDEYFSQYTDKSVFNEIYKYFDKFSNLPSKEALIIELSDRNDLTEDQFGITTELLNEAEATHQKENREDLVDSQDIGFDGAEKRVVALRAKLLDVVSREEYEEAAKLRDEIGRLEVELQNR